jgi:hypothetical protein
MPKTRRALTVLEPVEPLIREIRGERVILDTDLARVYGVPTFRFNEAVKRNLERFPADFRFQLTPDETAVLTSQIAMSKPGRGGRRTLPYAFTEHGAIMAANVLNSPRAVEMSIYVIRAFIKIRAALAGQADMARRLAEIEKTLIGHDAALRDLYNKIRPLLLPPEPKRREIGFHVKETGEAGTKGKTKR